VLTLLKQHYVPQFLQKAWAGSNGKVTTFQLDLPHIPSSELAPEYTGYENDPWSLTKDEILGMKKDAVEKRVFGRIDSDASKVHQLLLNRGLTKLTTGERSEWTRFLMSLKLREPAQVELLKLEASETLRHSLRDNPEEFQALAKDSDNPTLEDWTEAKFPGLISNFGINLIAGLVDDEKAANLFFQMKWWVALSARGLSERLRTSRATAARALNDLTARGFIEATRVGGFNLKSGERRATEWRLNRYKCDLTGQLPSQKYMRWKDGNFHFTISPESHNGLTREPLTASAQQSFKNVALS
jgi:hypothetical protein